MKSPAANAQIVEAENADVHQCLHAGVVNVLSAEGQGAHGKARHSAEDNEANAK
jgi:hypothetical protein